MEENKEKSLLERVKAVEELKEELENKKNRKKKIKLPSKAKTKGMKAKKGYVGILRISENGVITGEKVKIEGSAFNESSGKYHATDSREILLWQGKYPILVQKTWRKNPENFRKAENEKDETYGQDYIKARLIRDTIKDVKPKGNIIIWIAIGVAVLIGVNYFLGA